MDSFKQKPLLFPTLGLPGLMKLNIRRPLLTKGDDLRYNLYRGDVRQMQVMYNDVHNSFMKDKIVFGFVKLSR